MTKEEYLDKLTKHFEEYFTPSVFEIYENFQKGKRNLFDLSKTHSIGPEVGLFTRRIGENLADFGKWEIEVKTPLNILIIEYNNYSITKAIIIK